MKAIYWDMESQGMKFEYREIPAEPARRRPTKAREFMIEAAAEANEELMNKYLEDGELTEDEIIAGICAAHARRTRSSRCSAAPRSRTRACRRCSTRSSSSCRRRPIVRRSRASTRTTRKTRRKAGDDEPFSALAFKIMTDPFVGTLTFFRVYSGMLNSGDTVYNPIKSKKERIGRLLQMHANERNEIKEVRAGDIAAAVGLKDVTTGDTLCAQDNVITLERMMFPEPVISMAVEPKTKADQEKMGIALQPPRAGRSVVPRAHRRGIRPDHHLRHGRAAPGDHRRPHEARVQRRGQRRQAAGRLPRDDPQGRQVRKASSCASPAARASTATSWLEIEPQERGKGYEFENGSSAARFRRNSSRRSTRASRKR